MTPTPNTDLAIHEVKTSSLKPFDGNPRVGDVGAIAKSLEKNGQYRPIVVRRETDEILAGNHTWKAARSLKWATIKVTYVENISDEDARRIVLADNRYADLGSYDNEALSALLSSLPNLDGTGYDDDFLKDLLGDVSSESAKDALESQKGNLSKQFLIPPFTILDTRAGYWLERRRAWISLGIRSENGRDDALLYHVSDTFMGKRAQEIGNGTSVFDPVLCEIAYRWFSAEGGQVLDPFAGGSVRGVTAGMLGRNYTGIELRGEQVAENRNQWLEIGGGTKPAVEAVEEATIADPNEMTPVVKIGDIWVKRDDTFAVGTSRGGKVRACLQIVSDAVAAGGVKGLVTAGSRQSPQVNIVATIAKQYNIPCRVHVPAGGLTPELMEAQALGAKIVQHPAGRNSVIVARAREDAKEAGWLEIPFGMEHAAIVEATAKQVANLPKGIKRIVVPVGSGMALSGILHGLKANGLDIPVVGVQVGADPTKRLNKYAPAGWQQMVTIIKSELDYHDHAPTTRLGDIALDPVYESKTLPYLESGDLLWVVGRRSSAEKKQTNTGSVEWITGDSNTMDELLPDEFKADLVFSCPPYADLEVYSDDPADISNMPYEEFLRVYRSIIAKAVANLKNDRFIVWVIGEVRGTANNGVYRGFVPDTIAAFEDAGAHYYNEAILVNSAGTLPLRAGRTFAAMRKMGKMHQNVLVFVKGDAKKATEWCGPVEIGELGEEEAGEGWNAHLDNDDE